ncbi:MAG: SRPBCC family protein [Anaerolineales bacterium]
MKASHIAEELKIQFEIQINAPTEKVWEKMASVEAMNEWFAKNLIFEHRIGGRFQMEGSQPGDGPYKFTGEIVKIVPMTELAFTWKSELSEEGAWPVSTLVRLVLERTASGTRVTLIHTGFEALGEAMAKAAYEGHVQGWTMSETLKGLKESVESA